MTLVSTAIYSPHEKESDRRARLTVKSIAIASVSICVHSTMIHVALEDFSLRTVVRLETHRINHAHDNSCKRSALAKSLQHIQVFCVGELNT